jgi:hypothetical protein
MLSPQTTAKYKFKYTSASPECFVRGGGKIIIEISRIKAEYSGLVYLFIF